MKVTFSLLSCWMVVFVMITEVQCFQNNWSKAHPLRNERHRLYYTNSGETTTIPPSFRTRVFQIFKRRNKMNTIETQDQTTTKNRNNKRFSKNGIVQQISTFQDFHEAVVTNNDSSSSSIVVARFHAPWCQACRAMEASYYGMAKKTPMVKFLDVEISNDNINFYKGLGVPSVPFVHVYHPDIGLVEEQRLIRPQLKYFHQKVRDYIQASCSLVSDGMNNCDEEWSITNPYDVASPSIGE